MTNDKQFQENVKKYYSENEMKLIDHIAIFLGNASSTKSPEQEKSLKIYLNILEESLDQRIWETRKYYWGFFVFVLLVLCVVFGWFMGHKSIQTSS